MSRVMTFSFPDGYDIEGRIGEICSAHGLTKSEAIRFALNMAVAHTICPTPFVPRGASFPEPLDGVMSMSGGDAAALAGKMDRPSAVALAKKLAAVSSEVSSTVGGWSPGVA